MMEGKNVILFILWNGGERERSILRQLWTPARSRTAPNSPAT
jgi:hypothetical protein